MSDPRRVVLGVLVGIAWLLLWAVPAIADDPYRLNISTFDVTEYPTVRVIANVTDLTGRPVRGLSPGDLSVLEDDAVQQAEVHLTSESRAISLAVVLDTSGSMAGQPIVDAKTAIGLLIRSLGATDQAALLTFSSVVRIVQPFTSDTEAFLRATGAVRVTGDTALYDAVARAADTLDEADPTTRRVVVLLTDGVDTASRNARPDVAARLAASGATLYAIGLGDNLDRRALEALVAATPDGKMLIAPTSGDLEAIYSGIAEQIRTQYVASYRSTRNRAPGDLVRVELRLSRQGVLAGRVSHSYGVPGIALLPTPSPPTERSVSVPIATRSRTNVAVLVGLLGAETILMLLLWLGGLAGRNPFAVRRRVDVFVRADAVAGANTPRAGTALQRLVLPAIADIGRKLVRITPAGMIEVSRATLARAGHPMNLGPVEFLGVRFACAMLSAVLALVITTATDPRPALLLTAALMGSLAGYALPGFVLGYLARQRQHAIRRALPTTLDMLALGVEAGLALDGAVAQVAHRSNSPLADEFRRLLLEFQMGRERRQALREMARDAGVVELARFVEAIVQGDAFGVPLAKILHDQAVEMRTKRRQRAEELARVAPVKMLFPMILLIFPALLVVLLGPAVPRILDAFGTH